MGKHSAPYKSKHEKASEREDVKVYTPRNELADEQYAELPDERTPEKHRRAQHQRDFSKGKVVVVIFAAVIYATAWLMPTDGWMRVLIYLLPFVLAGAEIVFDAIEAIIAKKYLDKSVFMTICCIVAFAIDRGSDGVILVILYRAVDLLEAYVREKGKRATNAILDVQPYSVNLETADGILNVVPEDIRVDDIIVVNPGEYIPLDGVIIQGMSSVNTFALTGSSKPVTVKEGMRVFSGCFNTSRLLRIRVSTVLDDSTAIKLLRLVEESGRNRSRQESIISVIAKVYTPVMLGIGILVSVVPPIFSGDWSNWVPRGLMLILAANLSGLIESLPIAYSGAINKAYYKGILFKGTKFVEAFARTETMVFNKTGTLTEGRYSISNVFPENMSEHELLTLAASAEVYSEHPIARALREACGTLDLLDSGITQYSEMPGRGVSAYINGKPVYVGNALLMNEFNLSYIAPKRPGTIIYISLDGRFCGSIILNDKVREGAFEALETLRVQGIKNMVMLTGDLRSAARVTASVLNFDMVKSELLPEKKMSAVEYLIATMADSATLACVGDPVADAAVLKRAHVGIALGALTDNQALDNADVIIMANDLKRLSQAYKIAKISFQAAKLNIYFAAAVKAVVVLMGLFGFVPLWAAAFLDAFGMSVILLNSLRTLNSKKD